MLLLYYPDPITKCNFEKGCDKTFLNHDELSALWNHRDPLENKQKSIIYRTVRVTDLDMASVLP